MAAIDAVLAFPISSKHNADNSAHRTVQFLKPNNNSISSARNHPSLTANYSTRCGKRTLITACLSSPSPPASSNTKLYVSGLSFRTTEDGLRTAFQSFGELLEVNLVMDKIANRPRGFAFLRYATEEEAKKAIDGMHGKFLDGRVIFVEVAKPKSELRKSADQNPRLYR